VGGEFNGWAPLPLSRQQGETWAVHVDVEPGCYTYRFLVDGAWKVKEGEEVEEDEKGEKANVLIVEEEEDEEEVEQVAEDKEAVKEEVATIQDVLDTLTLENKQEKIDILPEESKPSEILKEESPKEEKAEEKDEEKVEEKDEEKVEVEDEKKVDEKDEKKVSPKVEMKETRSKRGKVTDKENTPQIPKEAVSVKEGTPKTGTPLIKAAKLGTPKLGTPKTGKLGKLHPDEVESPRRITRNLLAKLGPNASK